MTLNLQLQGLVLLLLFIAPGFIYSRSRLHVQPRYYKEESIFEQLVTTITASTIIHIFLFPLASLVLTGFCYRFGYSLALKDLLQPWSARTVPNLVLNGLGVATYLGCSLALAWYGGVWAGKRFTRPDSIPLWHRMLVEEPEKFAISPVWLTVRLCNEEEYTGALSDFVWVGDKENTIEIALEKVVYTKPGTGEEESRPKKAGTSTQKIALPDRRLLLRSSDILWLARIDESQKLTGREREVKGKQKAARGRRGHV
jgi:hypothetical protein